MRAQLDLIRTELANERTFLAYLRSSLALAVSGFSAIHFILGRVATYLGVVFLLSALICFAIGVGRFRRVRRALRGEGTEGASAIPG